MQQIVIKLAVEDELSEAVLRKMIAHSSHRYVVGSCFNRGGFGYLKKNIQGFNHAAKRSLFLVLTDLDRGECAPTLIHNWLSVPRHPNLLFRVAVREVESWVLASRSDFAKFLGISKELIPDRADEIDDPKQLLVNLAKKAKSRKLREAIVPRANSTAKVGPDYNGTLIQFVESCWDIEEAVRNSPSLGRAVNSLKNFEFTH
ncbi:MAG: hypothetical protein BWK80_03375 [Desulfobacteraceae bacterium IS3]|nr:MAG: hypothetical protein BWK80_03375 [Desulfobacteraceae bacterium IS3]